MKENTINEPELRFPGFTEPWEQRKVSELFKITRGYVLPATKTELVQTEEKVYPVYSSQTKDNGLMGYYSDYLYEDAITWTTDGANAGTVSYRSGKFYCTNVCGVLLSDKVKANKMIAEALNKVAKGYVSYVGNPKLMNNVMADIPIMIAPQEEEREKIGEYFSKLDNLITLHQRKCDQVRILKKTMLQKMFPKNGDSVPEIRFPGFTEDWEQRKFFDCVSEVGDGLHGTPIYSDEGNKYFINGNNLVDGVIKINEETKRVDESQLSKSDKALDDTTILMSINGTIGNLAYYNGEEVMLGKSAAFIKVSNSDKRFVYSYLQAPNIHSYFMNNLTGTTIKNLGLKTIREMEWYIPQNIEEQTRIGEYFYNLDNLITLHQRKCDELKEFKKSMLQKMFV